MGRFDDRGVDYVGKESAGSNMGWNGLLRRMSGVGGRCRIAGYGEVMPENEQARTSFDIKHVGRRKDGNKKKRGQRSAFQFQFRSDHIARKGYEVRVRLNKTRKDGVDDLPFRIIPEHAVRLGQFLECRPVPAWDVRVGFFR